MKSPQTYRNQWGKLPSWQLGGVGSSTSSSTSHTFNGLSIGSAHESRLVVAAIGRGDLTEVTFGGNPATKYIDGRDLVGGTWATVLYGLAIPAGTTTNVVLTGGSSTSAAVRLYSLYDLLNHTPIDIDGFADTADIDKEIFQTVVSPGIEIYTHFGGDVTASWDPTDELTQHKRVVGTRALHSAIRLNTRYRKNGFGQGIGATGETKSSLVGVSFR